MGTGRSPTSITPYPQSPENKARPAVASEGESMNHKSRRLAGALLIMMLTVMYRGLAPLMMLVNEPE